MIIGGQAASSNTMSFPNPLTLKALMERCPNIFTTSRYINSSYYRFNWLCMIFIFFNYQRRFIRSPLTERQLIIFNTYHVPIF